MPDDVVADHAAHFETNRLNWDERAPVHAASDTYDLAGYRANPDRLSGVVDFDRQYLGDLTGAAAVHLQCHLGTDTLSLARLGASTTGLDQSPVSLQHARDLFEATGTPGRFVEANVYDAVTALGARYDLVYTGVGALNWLPDIERWAAVVSELLAPGGRLYLREGHPMLWAIDEDLTGAGRLEIRYPYFETQDPLVWDEALTYTDGDLTGMENTRCVEWNHGLGEIVTALIGSGLVLRTLDEHRTVEWEALPHMVPDGDGRYRLPREQRDLVPLMYTLIATKG